MSNKIVKKITNQGFTLVELLVSISLFVIVLTIGVGSLLVLIDANAKAQNMQQVMTNVSFALDSMSREIRTGRSYFCTNNIATIEALDQDDNNLSSDCSGSTVLSIVEGGESLTEGEQVQRVAYRFNDTGSKGVIERRVGRGQWHAVTAPSVDIDEMYFYVTGTALGRDGDVVQPSVTIHVAGHAGEMDATDSAFALQTTVSKRVIDL